MSVETRSQIAGWLLLAMLCLSLLHAYLPAFPAQIAGLCSWLAGALLWPLAGRTQKTQALLLAGTGLALMLWAGLHDGVQIDYARLLTQNLSLISMLAAVSFLKLVSMPAGRGGHAATGPWAFVRTLFGVHLFGAVINMSAVVIVGDRLARRGQIGENTTRLLTCGFASAALWSPFFAAMATALLYAPGARMTDFWPLTLPLTAFGLLLTFLFARRASADALAGFRGYPMHFTALWVPALLVFGVLAVHEAAPALSVLTVVTTLAPLLALSVLPLRRGPRRALRRSRQHIARGLPMMRGELTLFLAAGVLAVGLFAAQSALGLALPFERFDGAAACATFGVMLLLSYCGVHAVVSIAAVAALAAPLAPAPGLMAAMYLMVWGIGAACSPFSGLGLSLQGRYGLGARQILRWNLRYALIMYAAGCAALLALDGWR